MLLRMLILHVMQSSNKHSFKLCEDVVDATGKDILYGKLKDALEKMSFYNYPYEATVDIKLLANPVKEVCAKFTPTDATLDQLAAAFALY